MNFETIKNQDIEKYLTIDIEEAIVRIANSFSISNLDLEDKVLELREHLKEKIPFYSPEKGSFKKWAIIILKRKGIDLQRSYGKDISVRYYSPKNKAESDLFQDQDRSKSPLERVAMKYNRSYSINTDEIGLKVDVDRALKDSSELNRTIFQKHIEGYSDAEICSEVSAIAEVSVEAVKKRRLRQTKMIQDLLDR